MKKKLRMIIVTLLFVLLSGCFPVFVPVHDDGGHGGGGGHHEHGEHHGGHD